MLGVSFSQSSTSDYHPQNDGIIMSVHIINNQDVSPKRILSIEKRSNPPDMTQILVE